MRESRKLLIQLMKAMGKSSKFTGQVATFLQSEEEDIMMMGYLIKNLEATDQEILRTLVAIAEESLKEKKKVEI